MYDTDVDLKIVLAFLQMSELRNPFKAIFELMNAETCDPSLMNQFVIFRMKVTIEQTLQKLNEKQALIFGNIDVKEFFKYEKLS